MRKRHVSPGEIAAFFNPEFRASNSYFVSHTALRKSEHDFFVRPEDADDGFLKPDEWHENDLLLVPLMRPGESGDEMLGFLSVREPHDRRIPTLEKVQTLEIFATQAVTALQSARQYEEIKRLTFIDALTPAYNHRFFQEALSKEIHRHSRTGHEMALAMLDIDNFKKINDTFGHPVGDEILKGLVEELMTNARDSDVVARYGGEEFAIIFPDTPAAFRARRREPPARDRRAPRVPAARTSTARCSSPSASASPSIRTTALTVRRPHLPRRHRAVLGEEARQEPGGDGRGGRERRSGYGRRLGGSEAESRRLKARESHAGCGRTRARSSRRLVTLWQPLLAAATAAAAHALAIATLRCARSLALLTLTSLAAQSLDERVQRELPTLLDTYKTLHATPELSTQEVKTSAFVAKRLRELGYEVTEKVGKYKEPDATCYGVVAVLRNGDGPVVLVRSDMDGLPVAGADRASVREPERRRDARLRARRAHDHAPRHGEAARRSEVAVARHGDAHRPAGGRDRARRRGDARGWTVRAVRAARFRGRAARLGHARSGEDRLSARASSWPRPIRSTSPSAASAATAPRRTRRRIRWCMAAETILALQTIASRERSPLDPVVVTVGKIEGGTKRNIIPDEVRLYLTVRTFSPEVRKRVLESIERIPKGIALVGRRSRRSRAGLRAAAGGIGRRRRSTIPR